VNVKSVAPRTSIRSNTASDIALTVREGRTLCVDDEALALVRRVYQVGNLPGPTRVDETPALVMSVSRGRLGVYSPRVLRLGGQPPKMGSVIGTRMASTSR